MPPSPRLSPRCVSRVSLTTVNNTSWLQPTKSGGVTLCKNQRATASQLSSRRSVTPPQKRVRLASAWARRLPFLACSPATPDRFREPLVHRVHLIFCHAWTPMRRSLECPGWNAGTAIQISWNWKKFFVDDFHWKFQGSIHRSSGESNRPNFPISVSTQMPMGRSTGQRSIALDR